MKIKQTEKYMGTQELVAVARYQGGDCRPCTIQAVRQPRRVYSGARWDFSGHVANDGVEVEYADGKREVVGPRCLVSTWSEYETARAAREVRRDNEKARLDASEAAAAAVVAELRRVVEVAPHEIEVETITYGRPGAYGISGYRIRVSTRAAEALLAKIVS